MHKLKHTIFILLISSLTGLSQNIQDDYSINIDSALILYKKKMHHDTDYVIGREYKIYHSYKQDNPYLNGHYGNGTIYSKGYIYDNKIILYDMHKDVLAVNTSVKSSYNINVELQKVRIDSFSIEFKDRKYLFIHMKNKDESHVQITSGFYEIPYKEKFQLLYKHISDKGDSEGITTYTYRISKILKIDNSYYNIDSRKKFINLFPTYKKQVKKKLRSIKTKYNKFANTQLIDLIKFAETL